MDPFGTRNDRRDERFVEALCTGDLRSSRGIEHAISWNRREFLRIAGGASAAVMLSFSSLRAMAVRTGQKAVVVTFGGRTRDEETFMPEARARHGWIMDSYIIKRVTV